MDTQNRQLNMTAKIVSIADKPFLFELEPYFQSDTLDFTNKLYFPSKNLSKTIEAQPYAKYHKFESPFMENEVKGFIRHIIVDNHNGANHVKGFVQQFAQAWCKFVNEKYPLLNTVIDIDYESIYKEYLIWLNKNNIKAVSVQKLAQVTKDMEWLYSPVKSRYISGFNAFYKYIHSIVYPDTILERDKDIWDIRNLGITYSTLPSRPRYTINYTDISQKWFRDKVKDYNFYRIPYKEMATILDDMKAFKLFSSFLEMQYPELNSLKPMNRQTAEDYIQFVRAKGFVASTFNRRISAIKTFLAIGNMLDMGGFPIKPIFMNSDYAKVVHKLPVPFSDNELRQLNKHISELPLQHGQIFFVLENCGMRMSDICSTPIMIADRSCLQKHGEDRYTFTYAQPKVHRTNSIPVSELVAEVISSAMEASKAQYGDDCKYVFAISKTQCVGQEDFVMSMNKMSKKNNLENDVGEPLRIKGHTFRSTKATEYANMGIGMDVIRMMLGQKKIGVLKHYVTIRSATMIDAMRNITDTDDKLIRNIGNVHASVIKESVAEGLLPLPNGYCAKSVVSGLCDHSNACYNCRMYRPSKEFLPIYKAQLLETENNIEIAKLNGYERLLEINESLRDSIAAIISMMEVKANA